jgi:predicted nucleic acid-binding Zn ribbon protein
VRKVEPVEIEPDAWCEWCGDSLPEPEERPARQKYCSRHCKEEARKDRARQEWAATLADLDCPHCGTRFRQNRACQVYCTPKCAANARYRQRTGRPVAIAARACIECGTSFTPRNLAQAYCGIRCKFKAGNARAKARKG